MDMICVNVDAAMFTNDQQMDWGMLSRDHTGSMLFSCNSGDDGSFFPELVEAMDVRWAMEVTRDKGLTNIRLVSDCLSLIQRIKAPERDRSDVGAVMSDIKRLATGF